MGRTQIHGDQFRDDELYPKDIASINSEENGLAPISDSASGKFEWVKIHKKSGHGLFELDNNLDYMPREAIWQEMEKDGNHDIQPLDSMDVSRIFDDEYELDVNGDIMPQEIETGV